MKEKMFKWVSAAVVLILLVTAGSCESNTKPAVQKPADTTLPVSAPKTEIKNTTVEGMVEVFSGGKEVYIVRNWESRSRVSLAVQGGLTTKIAALKGTIVRVIGDVVQTGAWSGTIEVKEILR